MVSNPVPRRGVEFHRPWAFWSGSAALTAGVLMHLPEFLSMADMHYRMAGMPMGSLMVAGMWLICGGFLLAMWGLLPPPSAAPRQAPVYHVEAMDDAKLTGAHWGLLFVLGMALVIDVMKPATIGFVLPGMSAEYGIPSSKASWLVVCALGGTTLGSVFWGVMADRIGRRAAILLASLMFIGTSICGAMPAFWANLLMCFLMGAAAGGMLPIVYALMAESIPAGPRGWLVVLHGGMGAVGGTLAAAACALLLEPTYSWRALWLMNLPTGVVMLILNHWIPESPRFLLERGREAEARAVLANYGVTLATGPAVPSEVVAQDALADVGSHWAEIRALLQRPHLTQTAVVVVYGLAWGLVNWGLIALLPTLLRMRGFGAGASSYLLFLSAFLAIPGTVLVAFAYGKWSSRKSMIVFALGSIAGAIALAVLAPTASTSRPLTIAVLALLYIATGGVSAMLSPYTAEVYPTRFRGTGSGLSAGATKLGGFVGGIATVLGLITTATGFVRPAIMVSIPLAIAAILVAVAGLETRGRRLEELAASRVTSPVS